MQFFYVCFVLVLSPVPTAALFDPTVFPRLGSSLFFRESWYQHDTPVGSRRLFMRLHDAIRSFCFFLSCFFLFFFFALSFRKDGISFCGTIRLFEHPPPPLFWRHVGPSGAKDGCRGFRLVFAWATTLSQGPPSLIIYFFFVSVFRPSHDHRRKPSRG